MSISTLHQRTINPVQEQLDAYNARDLERFLACYLADAIIANGAGDTLLSGEAQLREMYGTLFGNSHRSRPRSSR